MCYRCSDASRPGSGKEGAGGPSQSAHLPAVPCAFSSVSAARSIYSRHHHILYSSPQTAMIPAITIPPDKRQSSGYTMAGERSPYVLMIGLLSLSGYKRLSAKHRRTKLSWELCFVSFPWLTGGAEPWRSFVCWGEKRRSRLPHQAKLRRQHTVARLAVRESAQHDENHQLKEKYFKMRRRSAYQDMRAKSEGTVRRQMEEAKRLRQTRGGKGIKLSPRPQNQSDVGLNIGARILSEEKREGGGESQ